MRTDCKVCGITHPTKAEAEAMHQAMRRVRNRLRERLELVLAPVDLAPKKAKRPVRQVELCVVIDRKKGCRGYQR